MKLSVLMITCNHEKFIAQALDSILMQKVDFDYEIVIGEDLSLDRTRGIALEYKKRHPEKIRLLLHAKNLGVARNFIETFMSCRGKYLAILEGDDYWTYPLKLQKQVDILDANPDFVMCFHNTNVIYEGFDINKEPHVSNADQKAMSTIEDIIIKDWYIMTGSIMLRKNIIKTFPGWYYDIYNCDYALQLMLADHGKIYYIDEVMGTYRKHPGSIGKTITHKTHWLNLIKVIKYFDKYTNYKYHKIIKNRVATMYETMVSQNKHCHEISGQKLLEDSLENDGVNKIYKLSLLFKAMCVCPPLLGKRIYWGAVKRHLIGTLNVKKTS